VPIQHWFKGNLGNELMDLLDIQQKNEISKIFNREAVYSHLKHGLRTVNEAFQLWVIYNILVWHENLDKI